MVRSENKSILKRSLSIVITLIMLIGLLPLSVFAASKTIRFNVGTATDVEGMPDTIVVPDDITTYYLPWTVPTSKTKVFAHWSDGASTVYAPNDPITVSGNVQLTAVWDNKGTTSHTVSFAGTSDTTLLPAQITVPEDGWYYLPTQVPTRPEYVFTNWKDSSSNKFSPGQYVRITSDVTLTAEWAPVNKVTITYDVKGGSPAYASNNVFAYDFITLPAAPTKKGFTFAGWKVSSSPNIYGAGQVVRVYGSLTFEAQWTANPTYTISFSDGGITLNTSLPSSTSYEIGTVITLPAAPTTDAPYAFLAWENTTGERYPAGASVTVTATTTFRAVWDKLYSIIDFNLNGGTGNFYVTEVKKNENFTLPTAVPTKDGMVFAGWIRKDNGRIYAAGSTQYANMDYYLYIAKWESGVTKVTFDLVETGATGSFADMSVKKGENFTLPTTVPEKTGKVFTGWTLGAGTDLYAPGATFVATGATMAFKANWKDADTNIVKVTAPAPSGIQIFEADGIPMAIPYSKAIKTNDEFSFLVVIDKAYYKGKAPVVKANGGYLVGELVEEKTSSYVYLYTFKVKVDTILTFGDTVINKYVLSAPIGEHFDVTITTPSTTAKTAEVAYDGTFEFKVDARADWEIKNVYVNGVLLEAEAGGTNVSKTYKISNVKENKTILVDVEEIPSYLVTYYTMYGDVTEVYTTQYVLKDQKAVAPVAPSVDGYTFEGWYKEKELQNAWDFATDTVTADTVLYAKFTQNPYSVTYYINGGKADTLPSPNPASRKYGKQFIISAVVPTWTDGSREFIGWNTNSLAETALYVPGDAIDPYLDANISLYAIWENVDYQVNLFPGTGYTIWTEQSSTVLWGKDFIFNVRFDKGYTEGVDATTVLGLIKINGVALSTLTSGTDYTIVAAPMAADESLSFTVTIKAVKADKNVTVTAGKNKHYTVTYNEIFVYEDGTRVKDESSVVLPIINYVAQDVEWNTLAPVPVPPTADGYKFGGWYKVTDTAAAKPFDGLTAFDFATRIKLNTTLYAKMILKQVTVSFPADGTGYDIQYNADQVLNYGDDLQFTVDVFEGYDATNLVVAANGYAINPVSVVEATGKTTYTYKLIDITEDIAITVNGIERKTVIIIYNDNDGVAGPVYQVVNYYIAALADNTDIVKEPLPTRIGYTFEGWSVDPTDSDLNATVGALKGAYTKAEIAAGVKSQFQEDEVLYAIWKEAETTITLTTDKAEYFEGEDVLLTAKVTYVNAAGETVSVTSGKVFFYQNGKLLGSVDAEGGLINYTAKTNDYVIADKDHYDYYEAVYVPTEGVGFASAKTSADITFNKATFEIAEGGAYVPALKADILSRTITWALTRDSSAAPCTYALQDDAKALTVEYKGTPYLDAFIAGNTYTVTIPAVYGLANGFDDAPAVLGDMLTVGVDYYVVWQYKTDTSDWADYVTVTDSDSVLVTPTDVTTQYRALIYPVGAPSTDFDRAAKYNEAGLAADSTDCLISDSTLAATRKETTIGLKADKAEYYEGNEIELKAFVTYVDNEGQTVAIDGGMVYFYHKTADKTEYTLIGKVSAEGGLATLLYKASEYDAFLIKNADQFEAVYVPVANETYKMSTTQSDKIVFVNATAAITLAAGYVPATVETKILSKSITWPLTRKSDGITIENYVITPETDFVKVLDKDNADVSGQPLAAGDKYTLVLGNIYSLTDGYNDTITMTTIGAPLTVGIDYYIVWQYKVDQGDWNNLVTVKDSQKVVVTPEVESTVYRALVYPVGAPETEFEKAAQFNGNDELVRAEIECLVSKSTEKTNRKPSVITLAADKAEYAEGEKIVLSSYVTYHDANNDVVFVDEGMVYFYHKKADDANYELIATVEAKGGYAEYVYAASDYNAFAVLNADDFEAVYVPVGNKSIMFSYTNPFIKFHKENSTITLEEAYVPATVRTLIDSKAITWALDRTANDVAGKIVPESYKITEDKNVITIKDENGEVLAADKAMVANEPYTLTIPTVYALTWGYTDVKDGTAVAGRELKVGNDYCITWQYKNDHGDWVEYTTVSDSDSVYVTPAYSKYQFRARVMPLIGDTTIYTKACEFDKEAALLKTYTDAIYTVATPATVQNTVKVVVSASDEILATETVVDVYQGNEITLKAVVTSDDDPVKPFGSVTFYYKDEAGNEVKIATTDLIEDGNATVGYKYTAQIVTDVLPIRADGTYQKIEIYAIYTENDTFEEKDSRDDLTDKVADAYYVYVMSSVINVDVADIAVENLYNHNTTKGNIYITVDGAREDGSDVINPVANDDHVTLRLSEVYTRDVRRADYLTDDTANTVPDSVMLLEYGTHYTVQWQKLSNCDAYLDANGKPLAGIDEREIPWANLEGETGTSCHVTVEERTAYRAVVIPLDTDATFGSYNEVEEPVAGRGVYYSNLLRAQYGEVTLAFYLNSSIVDEEHKGVVEGEKVLVQVFESGSSAVPPVDTAYIGIYKDVEGDGEFFGSLSMVYNNIIAVTDGYGTVAWDTSDKECGPGYYYVMVSNNEINNSYTGDFEYRRVIVRDNNYTIEVDPVSQNVVYDGQFHGIDVAINGMDIESDLANTVWTVSYYKAEGVTTDPVTGVKNYGNPVFPREAGNYVAVVTLAESAYWTPKTLETTLTIAKRQVKVVDLVAAVKYYNGKNDANILEITLNDAVTDQVGTGLPTDGTGVINGDIVYVNAEGYTKAVNAGATEVGIKNATLAGPDATNYVFATTDGYTYTEAFDIQRNQLSGYIIGDWTQDFAYSAEGKTMTDAKYVLYDQYGTKITDPQIIYYYHNGHGIEKVDKMLYRGVYTIIVTMDQNNYKGGLTTIVGVNASVKAEVTGDPMHTVILFADTVTIYNPAGNTPIKVTPTLATATVTAEYYVDGAWSTSVPANAGRYLVKATASTGDVAYGLYTVLKANPAITLKANDVVYSSAPYTEYEYTTPAEVTEVYTTIVGDTVEGLPYYQGVTEVGTYTMTLHTVESANYAPYEVSATFKITPKKLTIYADQYQRGQYEALSQYIPLYSGFAYEGVAPDTSLRDVQIEPEIVFNMTDGIVNVDNNALDQVGVINLYIGGALAKNYEITYLEGKVVTTKADPECALEIKGMPQSVDGNLTYYGDEFRLYAYGNKKGEIVNTSSLYTWSVDNTKMIEGYVSIDQNGNVWVNGVGKYSITLTRGYGVQAIEVTEQFIARPQELMVYVPNQDYVFANAVKTYDVAEMEVYNAMFDKVLDYTYLKASNLTRTYIGTQVVTAKVDTDVTTKLYCSEIYDGLLTVNDKEVTVNVANGSHIYGQKSSEGTTYIEGAIAGGLASLTDVRSAAHTVNYDNVDVGAYEIFYAGRENINYNVKYTTAPTVGKESVTPKALTVSSGAYNAFTGRTFVTNIEGKTYYNSYLPDNADALMKINHTTTAADFRIDTLRMYGEANKSMALKVEGFIAGDTMADLKAYNPWLNTYANRIDESVRGLNYTKANADVRYHYDSVMVKTDKVPSRVTLAEDYYDIVNNATMVDFKNYTVTYVTGEEHIYQRPVSIRNYKLDGTEITETGDANGDHIHLHASYMLDTANNYEKLRNYLIDKKMIRIDKFNGIGGLATALDHTINDVKLNWLIEKVGDSKLKITITLGNPNYWLANNTAELEKYIFYIDFDRYSYIVDYENTLPDAKGDCFLAGYSVVTLYYVDGVLDGTVEDESKLKKSYLPNDDKLYCYIYLYKKNGDYSTETPVFKYEFKKVEGQVGVYRCDYKVLPSGRYCMFAVTTSDSYNLINDKNH